MITSTTDVYLIIFVTIVLVLLAGLIHYNGFKMGYKMGLKKGFTEVNKYALKINESQNERITQLMQEVDLQKCKRSDRIGWKNKDMYQVRKETQNTKKH